MADNTDDTLDERLDTILRRAESFRELLTDGDEVTIAFQDGELHVEESYRSKFERKHPKLFGRMLAIEAQLEPSYLAAFAAMLLAAGLLFTLHVGWWEDVVGPTASTLLQGWWFTLIVPCFFLYLARLVGACWQTIIYRRNRPALFDLIATDQLDRDILLVMLRDDGEVDRVLRQLKLDTAPSPQAQA
jgi:hypothetical protein